ncbi:MAG: tetratricopeptide repeat protein, partial [Cyanobacteria bacterium]|nr:tetratricopeptide repeat protein [Cyanobacteriota bacterium]
AGLDEVNLALIQEELGNICFCRQEFEQAELNYQQSAAIMEEVFDPEHAYISGILDNLARLYIMQERYEEAELVCKRSLKIKEKTILAQDCSTLESMRMMAIVEICLQKFDYAEVLLNKAIAILEPSTIGPFEEFLRLLGRVHEGKGDREKAEQCYRRSIEVFMHRQGQQSGLASCELDYARFLDELGRTAEATRARRVAEVAERNRLPTDDLPENSVYQPLSYPMTIFH